MRLPIPLLAAFLAASATAQTHTRTSLVRGQLAELRVTAAPPRGAALFLFGFAGLGRGPCLTARGPCLDVLPPWLVAPVVLVDGNGTASLGFQLPRDIGLIPVATQAVLFSTSLQISKSTAIDGRIQPITALSDEFGGTRLGAGWRILNPNTFSHRVANGALYMRVLRGGPANSWFANGEGPYVYKLVTGDFEVSARVHSYRVSDPNRPPAVSFNLGGLCVRDPVAPSGDHDWVHLTVGAGDARTPLAVEDKNTVDSRSSLRLYPIPRTDIEVRITRRGVLVSCFWRRVGATAWTALRSFPRPDLPATVQVGVNAGWWPNTRPDYEQRIDWIRFAR